MSIMQLTQTIHILPSVPGLQSNRATQPMLPGLEPEEETRPMVTNRQIAEALSSIAGLLEFQNSNRIVSRLTVMQPVGSWICLNRQP